MLTVESTMAPPHYTVPQKVDTKVRHHSLILTLRSGTNH